MYVVQITITLNLIMYFFSAQKYFTFLKFFSFFMVQGQILVCVVYFKMY